MHPTSRIRQVCGVCYSACSHIHLTRFIHILLFSLFFCFLAHSLLSQSRIHRNGFCFIYLLIVIALSWRRRSRIFKLFRFSYLAHTYYTHTEYILSRVLLLHAVIFPNSYTLFWLLWWKNFNSRCHSPLRPSWKILYFRGIHHKICCTILVCTCNFCDRTASKTHCSNSTFDIHPNFPLRVAFDADKCVVGFVWDCTVPILCETFFSTAYKSWDEMDAGTELVIS